MKQTKVEVYDDSGLKQVYYIDQEEDPNLDDLIKQKESQLLEIYEEIKKLKEAKGSS